MSTRNLPESPSLENLKKQAKTLLKDARSHDAQTLARVGPYFGDPAAITLQSAQLVLAREHGFASWTRLKRHLEGAARPSEPTVEQRATRFLDLVCLAYGTVQNAGPARFAEAKSLLEEYPDIRDTSIHVAAAIGDVERIDRWLDRDPKLISQKGGYHHWQPLMYAAYARLPGVSTLAAARRLIERGADPNAYYMWGGQYKFTALTGVFGQGEDGPTNQPEHPDYQAFARLLLKAGADPNDSQAAYNRVFEPDNSCLELLIEFGLGAEERVNWFDNQDDEMVPSPLETVHFQLVQAIRRGNFERAKLLIDAGADLNKPDDTYDTLTKGKTPLEAALLLGETRIADYLRKCGAVDTDLSGADRLQSLCMAGDAAAARQLLLENPDLQKALDQRGSEMVSDAVATANRMAIATLVDLGVDIVGKGGRPPVHMAAWNGDLQTVRFMIDKGADPSLRDPDHFSPAIGFALHAGRPEMVAFLETQKMDVFTAAARGLTKRLREMIAAEPNLLDARFETVLPPQSRPSDRDWVTPLGVAANNGRSAAVELLLELGADPTAGDGEGRTVADLTEDEAIGRMLQEAAARRQ